MRTPSPHRFALLSVFLLAATAITLSAQTSAIVADRAPVRSNLIQASDGNSYGTTLKDGGSIFKLTPDGVQTTLYSFKGDGGNQPQDALVEGPDGNFYGVASLSETGGSVFKITPAGALTIVYTFQDGARPQSGLTLGSDGNFYGVSSSGNAGSLFRITLHGAFTPLFDLPASGAQSAAPLLQSSDGFFYGTSGGIIFKVSPEGNYTLLHALPAGASLSSTLSEDSDGNFHATTNDGAQLKMTPTGTVTVNRLFPVTNENVAPVQLELSQASVAAKTPVTLSWKVLNAFSTTMRQCYAYGKWSGKQSGSYDPSTRLFTGSAAFIPSAPGTYSYALTCGGQESGFAELTVTDALLPSSTTLAATPNPVTAGQTVTLTATVTGSGTTPTGAVGIFVGGYVLGAKTLKNGSASISASTNDLPLGSYSLAVYYKGDENYAPSISPFYEVTLQKAPTATTLTASPNPVQRPGTVTLTATVKRSANGASGTPTGTVTFTYGTKVLGTAQLSAGVANFQASTSGLPLGIYFVKATYAGDSYDNSSISAPVGVIIY